MALRARNMTALKGCTSVLAIAKWYRARLNPPEHTFSSGRIHAVSVLRELYTFRCDWARNGSKSLAIAGCSSSTRGKAMRASKLSNNALHLIPHPCPSPNVGLNQGSNFKINGCASINAQESRTGVSMARLAVQSAVE